MSGEVNIEAGVKHIARCPACSAYAGALIATAREEERRYVLRAIHASEMQRAMLAEADSARS